MKVLTGYCINCNSRAETYTVIEEVEYSVKDVLFNYYEKSARCKQCGQPVYVPELNDENVSARNLAYRQAKSLYNM